MIYPISTSSSQRMMLTDQDFIYIGERLKASRRKSRLVGYFEGLMIDYIPPPHASPTPPPLDSSCDNVLPITTSGTQGSLESSPRCSVKEREIKTYEHRIVQRRDSISCPYPQQPIETNTVLPVIKNRRRKADQKSKVMKTYPHHPMRTRSKSKALKEEAARFESKMF
jgi:hypothetical protein